MLANERNDPDAAEALYKRALETDPRNADVLGHYALLLMDERKCPDAAEALFKRALEADPKDENVLGNYARFLFAKGQMDQAQSVLAHAIAILDAEHPTEINAECWMYAFCNCMPVPNTDSLAELKHLIVELSIRTGEWDFSEIIAQAIKTHHPAVEWLPRLAAVLAGRAPVEILDAWAA